MKASKIPVYIYGTAGQTEKQFGPGFAYFMQDDALIDKYKQYTSWHTLYEWQDAEITNVARIVNDFVGEAIINKTITYYTNMNANAVTRFPDWFNKAVNIMGVYVSGISNDLTGWPNLRWETINGGSPSFLMATTYYADEHTIIRIDTNTIGSSANVYNNFTPKQYGMSVIIYPEDMWDAETGQGKSGLECIEFKITGNMKSDISSFSSCKLEVRATTDTAAWCNYKDDQGQESDVTNPFGDDGNDGGDGDNDNPLVDPTDIPELPTLSASDTGLITLYNPSKAQLSSLASFLWSGAFDPDSFKKLFTDPMQCLIGLGIVPAIPGAAGSKNIRFGNVDSGVNCSYLSSQYVKVNCGSVSVKKQVGSFLDYTNTSISIYLPYIGFRDLSTDDVMGGSLQVVYNIDVLSGSCSVFIKHSARGVLYNYNGSCITNVPLCANNYSGAIQNAVSTVASGVGVIAGAASGAAPITLASGAAMLNSAANTVMNSKPQIQRSGNLGGSAGILSAQKPFIVIQRPNYSVPDFYNKYVGYMSNKTLKLGDCSGFTMVDWVHLEGIPGTEAEVNEIEALLKEGVML